MFFIGIIFLVNVIYFNSILIASFLFFLMLFLSTTGSSNFSVALISMTGSIITQVIVLMSFGVGFLGISTGIIYAGAILVMILFVLVLINNSKFENLQITNNNEVWNVAVIISLFLIITNFINQNLNFSFVTFSKIFEKQNLINAKFYYFSNAELYNLSSELIFFSSSIFYILGLFIAIASIFLLSLLRNVYSY